MKKITLSIVSLAIFVLSCFMLTSCHSCAFGEWVVEKAATCVDDGVEVRKCECGEKEERPILATGHSFGNWIIEEESTCTKEGKEVRTCECGEKEERDIELSAHNYGEWTVETPATCTEEGKEVRTCECGEKEERDIETIPHSYSEWIVATPATCTEQGLEIRTCECNDTESRIIPAGHKVNLELSSDETYYIVTGKGCGHGIIPSEYNGIPVKAIGSRAFQWSNMTEITIPEGIESIGDYAFSGCSSLQTINLPSSITTIGEDAFYNCSKLTKVEIDSLDSWLKINFASADANPLSYAKHLYVNKEEMKKLVIPENTTSINQYTFYNCEGLTSVKIPSTLTNINASAFYNCLKLTKVEVDSLDSWLKIDFANIDANPLNCAKYLYVNGEKLQDIVIPEGTTSIKPYAFSSCDGILSISIPASVTTIGESAFYNFSKYIYVKIEDLAAWASIDFASADANPLNVAGYLYVGETKVVNLVIPENVENINDYAFYNCMNIKTLTVQNGTATIGDYAFYSNSLETVSISSSVTSIGTSAFEDCTYITDLTINEGVLSIGSNAFASCSNLKFLIVPKSVTSIGKDAFTYCYKLNYVSLPFVGETRDSKENVKLEYVLGGYNLHYSYLTSIYITDATKIGKSAFEDWHNLERIELSNTITTIESKAFYNCYNLTSLDIPSSVTSIGTNVLTLCSKLRSVDIPFVGATPSGVGGSHFGYLFGASGYYSNESCVPSTLKTVTITTTTNIPDYAFYNCETLETIDLPKTLETIGEYAFYNCSYIDVIVIPINVTTIEKYAFTNCYYLERVTFKYPYDWYVTRTYGSTFGTNLGILSDTYTNSDNLTYYYDDYYWYRSK